MTRCTPHRTTPRSSTTPHRTTSPRTTSLAAARRGTAVLAVGLSALFAGSGLAAAQSADAGSVTGSLTGLLGDRANPSLGLGSTGDTGSAGSLGFVPPMPAGPQVRVETVLDGLSIPWDVAVDPTGVVLTGERDSGRIHAVFPDGRKALVAADLGRLRTGGESGLMSLAPAADFSTTREVYTCHSDAGANDNRVLAWRATPDWSRLESPRVVVSGLPMSDSGRHAGCRVLAHPDGTLYIGTGDALSGPGPQSLDSLAGKILHVTRNGEPASGDHPGTIVHSRGHRNVQGLAVQPGTGRIYSAEHGPDVDDEMNLVVGDANYGWDPDRGGAYDQSVPMTDLRKFPDAVRAVWSSGAPTLAPSGMGFLDHPSWGAWNGSAVLAGLKSERLVLLSLSPDGTRVERTAAILQGTNGRLRSVTPAPDGSLLVTTSNGGGRDSVLRVRPA